MARYILTGQPPAQPGRRAVGPLASDREALAVSRELVYVLGWTEVWAMPLDQQVTDRMVGELDREASDA